MLDPVRVAGPLASPVSLDEVRAQQRLDTTQEDALLQIYVDAAVGWMDGPDGILGRVLMTQSWQQAYSQFTDPLWLPAAIQPVQAVTQIIYYDLDGIARTLSPTLYRLAIGTLGARVERSTTDPWPATVARDDAVTVEFVAGQNKVAAPIRLAILLLVGHWYENRETTAGAAMAGLASELPFAVTVLLANQARIPV